MRRAHSIRARLSLVFVFLFVLVIILGLESLSSLSYVNQASAQIRLRWLPSARALGDLNNFTTDFPAAEAALLRAGSASERAVIERQMAGLDRSIDAARSAYRQISRDAVENELYRRFETQWSEYRRESTSKSAYDLASGTLGELTERNVASAREASERSERAYRQARTRIALTILVAGLLVAGATLYVYALAVQATMLREELAEEQRVTLLQRNFVSMASHEFRSPLAIIDGHAQRLISMKDRLSADELAERARKIRNAARRMTELIDNLLGSARLIDGRTDLWFNPTRVDLTTLLRELCQQQRELTPNARILDPSQQQQHPLAVRGDPVLLCQVFGNLLSNAVKYSRDGELVRVSAAAEDGEIAVVIEDRGIGIPEKDQLRVFERYYRGSNTSGIVGSGVGLYLVKTIVDLHEGSVALASREGAGSRFEVRLPITGMTARSASADNS
jgi:two-component system OmpR family sensor kinase